LPSDLENIPFPVALTHISGFEAGGADVHGLLKTVEVLFGKIDGGLGEGDVNKLLAYVEDELALVIGNLRTRNGGGVLCSLQAMLAFLATFEGAADSQVELALRIDVVGVKLAGLKNGQVLRVPGEDRIGAEIGGDFESLVLEDGGAGGLESVIVLESEADGLVEGNACGGTLRRRRGWERRG